MNDTSIMQNKAAAALALDSLQRVSTTVAVAQGLAISGRSIDLNGLDTAAGLLCAQVLDLSPSDGSVLRYGLMELEQRLALLAKILRPQQ